MEKDLLTENEFITPANYNPWPSFALFYCIAIAQVIAIHFASNLNPGLDYFPAIVGALNLVTTVALCLTMFLYKQQNLFLPWRTKIIGMLVLVAVYTTAYFAVSFISYNSWIDSVSFYVMQATSMAVADVIIFSICGVIIYFVQRSKQKKGKL